MVFPATNTNKHQHTPHPRCLLEEWFHLRSLESRGQSSSCHLAPSFVSWCCSQSSHYSISAQDWSTTSSGCWSSAWGQESSGWSWGMAEVVSWPLNQTCPRCHWKRLNKHLEENSAGERSYQHLLYLLVHIKSLAVLSRKTQAASVTGFVTHEHCVNFIAHQREECNRHFSQPYTLLLPPITLSVPVKDHRQQRHLVSDESLNFMLSAEFLSFFPQISLWIARKKISRKSRLLQKTWQPPTLCQVPIP